MRLKIVYTLCVILLGGLIGTLLMMDPGYMMISYASVTIEASLWAGVLILLLLMAFVWVVVRLAGATFKSAGGLNAWNIERRVRGARQQTVQGALAVAEGDWERARRILSNSAERSETPFISYLNAARAAHELGDAAPRDEYLRLAHESTPGSDLAIGITKAELQLSKGECEQCLVTLNRLKEDAPKHQHVLRMLKSVYECLDDWEAMETLLPALERNRAVDSEERARLQQKTWLAKFERSLATERSSESDEALAGLWKQVPRRLRRDGQWVLAFAKLAADHDAGGLAEAALRECVSRNWSEELVAEYGRVEGDDVSRQLVTAERWLKGHDASAPLLLALGRLSMRNHLWAKAREYFEASLEATYTPEASAELGRLYASLGDFERGASYLKEALRDIPVSLPRLPLPEASTSLATAETP